MIGTCMGVCTGDPDTRMTERRLHKAHRGTSRQAMAGMG